MTLSCIYAVSPLFQEIANLHKSCPPATRVVAAAPDNDRSVTHDALVDGLRLRGSGVKTRNLDLGWCWGLEERTRRFALAYTSR